MRPLLSRPALLATLALAFLAARLAAENVQKLQQDLQRQLTRETDKFVSDLSSQRNTPSGGGSTYGIGQWAHDAKVARERFEQEKAEHRAREREARQSDERWKRDHPGETREQFSARAKKERAAAAYAASPEGLAESGRRELTALLAKAEKKHWDAYRAKNHNFTGLSWPSPFATPAQNLAWYRAQDRATPNPWSIGNAAILLIDGLGVPADPAEAARILKPRTQPDLAGEPPRPELVALFAYVRARHPEACDPLGIAADPATARRDLEALALNPANPIAKWYAARLLAASADPADQKKALQFLPDGHAWMNEHPAQFLTPGPTGADLVALPLKATTHDILQRTAAFLPDALQTWSLEQIEAIAPVIPNLAEPLRTSALNQFANTFAERFVPATPTHPFPYSESSRLLVSAGNIGSPAVFGLAALEQNQLIQLSEGRASTPSFSEFDDLSLSLPILSRWATRTDLLGTRARLALAARAHQAVNPGTDLSEPFASANAAIQAYREAYEIAHHFREAPSITVSAARATAVKTTLQTALAAIAARDAAAPAPSATSSFVGTLTPLARRQKQLRQLNNFPTLDQPADPALFAVASDTFNLDRAARSYDAAFEPNPLAASSGQQSRYARSHALFEAIRLGDAFAPRALAQEVALQNLLTDQTRAKLRTLTDSRRARDETAHRPRALAARIIETAINNRPFDDTLLQANLSNYSLATRLQLDRRLGIERCTTVDCPPSWELAPALIAEFDTAVVALATQPANPAEWHLMNALVTSETKPLPDTFPFIDQWENDRQDRLTDPALVRSLQPAFDALLVTLAQWPGLDHEDPRHEAWLAQSDETYAQAEKLIATDGLAALKLCLQAAISGNRDALQLLAFHIRRGTGQLPRSAAFADRILGAYLKIMQADAEVGDAYAAHRLAHTLIGHYALEGNAIPQDPVAGLAWLRYSAERGNNDSASQLRTRANSDEFPKDPAAERHWDTVYQFLGTHDLGQLIPIPPRRLSADLIELTPILPALEAALTTANRRLADPQTKPLSPDEAASASTRYDAALQQSKTDPAAALAALAQLAATGHEKAALTTTQFLAGGRFGLRPDQPLARRFHTVLLAIQQAEAEAGDHTAALYLGLHYLEFAAKPDPVLALRWLTYSAARGNRTAADFLTRLTATGAPGIPADPAASDRWVSVSSAIDSAEQLPIPPLRTALPTTPLAPLLAQLQTALDAAQLIRTPSQLAARIYDRDRLNGIDERLDEEPATMLLALAQLTAEGHSAPAFKVAAVLSSGAHGIEPDPALAQKFHTTATALARVENARTPLH